MRIFAVPYGFIRAYRYAQAYILVIEIPTPPHFISHTTIIFSTPFEREGENKAVFRSSHPPLPLATQVAAREGMGEGTPRHKKSDKPHRLSLPEWWLYGLLIASYLETETLRPLRVNTLTISHHIAAIHPLRAFLIVKIQIHCITHLLSFCHKAVCPPCGYTLSLMRTH